MLSVEQSRTVEWERDASDFSDTEMTSLAEAMLNTSVLWTDLVAGATRADTIVYEERRLLVVCYCFSATDDLHLQIINAQYV